MRRPSTSSSPFWRLPARTPLDAALAAPALVFFILLGGCASPSGSDLLVDPLKQRLLAREDIALQNLLLARVPAYGPGGSYLEAPYDGPAVEPPLPDLNLLPEDLPPWEESADPPAAAPRPTPIEPVPAQAAALSSHSARS